MPAAAHGQTGEVNPVFVDPEAFFYICKHVVHVFFHKTLVTRSAARIRRSHNKVNLFPGREGQRCLYVRFAGGITFTEYPAQFEAVVGARSVQHDHQRVFLFFLEIFGQIQGIRLFRIVGIGEKTQHLRACGEFLRSGLLKFDQAKRGGQKCGNKISGSHL